MLKTNQQSYTIPLGCERGLRDRHSFEYSAAHLLPAFNNSLVVQIKAEYKYCSTPDRGNQPQIIEFQHIMYNGQISWKEVFNVKMGKVVMLNDHDLIFYDSYRQQFTLVSLLNYSTKKIEMFGIAEGSILDVFVFGETNLLALTFKLNNMLEVRYYDIEGFKNGENCLAAIVVTLTTSRFQKLYKVNNRSLIGWPTADAFVIRSSHPFMFDFVSYHRQTGIQHQKITTVNTLNDCLGLDPAESYTQNWIESISEITANRYLITIPRSSFVEEGLDQPEIFVINSELGHEKALMTPLNGVNSLKNIVISGNWMVYCIRKYLEQGDYYENVYSCLHIAHTNSPSVGISITKQPDSKQTVQTASWDNDTLYIIKEKVAWSYQNQREMVIQVDTLRSLKDICMQLMLHINEDFDDDLLQQGVEMIAQ